jgi:hypothetical protein
LSEQNANVDEGSRLLDLVRAFAIRPAEARRIVAQYRKRTIKEHQNEDEWQRQERIADQIIARYARLAALVGGGTSLTGVVPGLGTAVAATGGTALDSVTCIKLQADLCFCLAEAFEYDLTSEDARNLATLVAAGATLERADARGVVQFASRAGVRLLHRYVRKAALRTAKELLAKAALALAGGALARSLPFGLGAIVSSYTSFARTRRTGQQAKQWFLLDRSMAQEAGLGKA